MKPIKSEKETEGNPLEAAQWQDQILSVVRSANISTDDVRGLAEDLEINLYDATVLFEAAIRTRALGAKSMKLRQLADIRKDLFGNAFPSLPMIINVTKTQPHFLPKQEKIELPKTALPPKGRGAKSADEDVDAYGSNGGALRSLEDSR